MTGVDSRLGYNGADEIKKHPFFKGVDWMRLRQCQAPFVPDLDNELDTRYFDKFNDDENFYPEISNFEYKRVFILFLK